MFEVELRVTPDCAEELNEEDIHAWVVEQFEGCDVGEVEVVNVSRVEKEK